MLFSSGKRERKIEAIVHPSLTNLGHDDRSSEWKGEQSGGLQFSQSEVSSQDIFEGYLFHMS